MSDNSKKYRTPCSDVEKIISLIIDFSVSGAGSVGVHNLNQKLPSYHDVVNVDVRVHKALTSAGGTAIIAIGTDNIATDPDNMVNDAAIGDIDADNDLLRGEPQDGTNKFEVGTSDATVAYKIGTEDVTGGVLIVLVKVRPTK